MEIVVQRDYRMPPFHFLPDCDDVRVQFLLSSLGIQQELDNRGFQIIGVAVDNEENVREFASEMAMNYPILAGEMEAIELSQRYGNTIGGLPFSAIIDKNGKVTHTIMGELTKDRLISILEQLGLAV
jgi:peroxiredoxin